MKELLLCIIFVAELAVCGLLVWTGHWIIGSSLFVFVLLNGVKFK